jgi:hypothetical protein
MSSTLAPSGSTSSTHDFSSASLKKVSYSSCPSVRSPAFLNVPSVDGLLVPPPSFLSHRPVAPCPFLSRLHVSSVSPTSLVGACTGSRQVFIGISGLIGAGKSTLAKSLAERLDLPVHYEPVADNEYLEDFYGDIKKYSFPMQVYLLNRRFQQQQQIVWQGHGGVQDRTIYEDSVFARMLRNSGLMDERDYQTYCR